jgi:tetratricopeptide (TPR) repeat protein
MQPYPSTLLSFAARQWDAALGRLRTQDLPGAAALLRELLDALPSFLPAHLQLAYVLRASGCYADAHAHAIAASRLAKDASPDLAVQLGQLLHAFVRPMELQQVVRSVDWGATVEAPALVEAARLIAEHGLTEDTFSLLERAEKLEPSYPHQHYIRGSLLATTGDMEGAAAALRHTITLAPEHAAAYWMLSVLPACGALDGCDISQMTTLLQRAPAASAAKAQLGYALHNVLHRAGQYDAAWRALQEGMRARRESIRYDENAQMAIFDALEAFDPACLAPVPREEQTPDLIFIIGMHRSGTTLLERILSGHTQVTDGGESYVLAGELRRATDRSMSIIDVSSLKRLASSDTESLVSGFRRYAAWRSGGRAVLTEKLPSYFLIAGIIARLFPEARIIHMRRDPVDTCFSNLRTFFGEAAAYSYDQGELGRYYLRYRRLMAHWSQCMPDRILHVDYDDLVLDFERQTRRILKFCGLSYEAGTQELNRDGGRVATASLGTARAGILRDRGRAWLPYAGQLGPLRDLLERTGSGPV